MKRERVKSLVQRLTMASWRLWKCPWIDAIWWLVVGLNFRNRRWGILEGCVIILVPFSGRTVVSYQNAFVPQTKIQLAMYTCYLICPIVLSGIL